MGANRFRKSRAEYPSRLRACQARFECLPSRSEHQRPQSPQQNDRVHGRAVVPDGVEIKLELGHVVFGPGAVGKVDLGPARESRPDTVSEGIEGDLPFESSRYFRALRPWTDQAHLAAKDIQKLGELVDAPPSEQPADGEHPGVVLFGEGRALAVRAHSHGSQLEELERSAVLTHPLLTIDDGQAAGEQHRQGCNDENRRRENEHHRRRHQIEESLQIVER